MTRQLMKIQSVALLVLAAAIISQSTPTFAQAQTFFKPKYGGHRLDWCFRWGQNCGRPVADHYCRIKGFNGALQFKIDHNIGVPNYVRTRLIAPEGKLCNYHFCDGFKFIQCQR